MPPEPIDALLEIDQAGEVIWKTFRLEIKEANEDGTFEGYASVFGNVDSDREVMDKGCFARTLAHSKGVVPVLWQHDRTQPCGWNQTGEEDNYGLKVHALLLIDTEFGRYAHSFVKTGLKVGGRPGLSIGFRVPKGGDYSKDGVRHFKEVILVEYSIVTFPANDLATATAAKGAVAFQDLPLALEARAWNSVSAVNRVRAWAGGTDEAKISWAKYRRGFLWFDSADPQRFGSYRLPIADVIDGKLMAVPRAIYAAAGGHGVNGASIPDADKARVRGVIARYYKKMGKDSPFKSDGGFMRTHFKAEDFNSSFTEAVQLSDLQELRWTMESALRQVICDICEDEEMTLEDKKTAVGESISQYAVAITAWWNRYLDITTAEEGSESGDGKSFRQFFETVKLGKSVTVSAKEGRAISAATKRAMAKAGSFITESMGHAKMSSQCKAKAMGVIADLSEGIYSNDVNKPNPVGGKGADKPADAPSTPPGPPAPPAPDKPAEKDAGIESLFETLQRTNNALIQK